jgi:hypothetical protein
VLERAAKEARVGRDGFVEVRHGESDMVNARGLHYSDATSRLQSEGERPERAGRGRGRVRREP